MRRGSLIVIGAALVVVEACAPRSSATTATDAARSDSVALSLGGTPTVLERATIIDATGSPPQSDMTVVIRAGRIVDIYPSGSKSPPAGAEIRDLSGRYLMPGLIDSHIHLGSRPRPPGVNEALLRNAFIDGVTTVRDMGGSMSIVVPLAQQSATDTVPMPRIYYSAVIGGAAEARWFDGQSGEFMAGGAVPGESPLVQRVASGTDVRAAIARAKAAGATGIKFYGDVEPDLLRSLTAEAHRQGLRTWSHLAVPPSRPSDVVGAGVQVVTHGDQFRGEMTTPLAADMSDSLRRIARQQQFALMSPYDTAMTRLLELMRQRGTMLDPTLWVMVPLEPASDTSKANMDRVLMAFRFSAAMTRRAVRMGIPIVSGTDGLGGSTANIHAEMQLLVDSAGLTPLQAIRAATVNGARALGLEDSLGTVAVGKRADLLILRADPSENIRNTQTVVAVVKAGRYYERTTPRRPGPLAAPPSQ